jgi:ankyrin repeat protein
LTSANGKGIKINKEAFMDKTKLFAFVVLAIIGFGCVTVANAEDNTGTTTLIAAASKGDTQTVKLMITNGTDVNARDKNGMTALMWAATFGYTDTVKLLIANGADVNAVNNVGWSVLRMAAGHQDIVDILQKSGALDLYENSRVKD